VLFNRFYQPDYDLEALEVVPNLILSNSHELLLRLHWIAVIYGSVKADLALTGGVHSATDVVKSMMAGAKVAMMTSALLKRGITYLDTISTELLVWMGEHEYDSIKQMQGSMSRNAVPQPGAFERANYMKVLAVGQLAHVDQAVLVHADVHERAEARHVGDHALPASCRA
jgi:dihydroorotate dehydrogenase (fumarate)